MVTEGQAEVLAEQILKPILASYGFARAAVRAGYDHDGDAALFIEAFLDQEVAPVDGMVTAEAIGALHEALTAQHDQRFPYLSYRRPSDETLGLGDD